MAYMKRLSMVMAENGIKKSMENVKITTKSCQVCGEPEMVKIANKLYWCKKCEFTKVIDRRKKITGLPRRVNLQTGEVGI